MGYLFLVIGVGILSWIAFILYAGLAEGEWLMGVCIGLIIGGMLSMMTFAATACPINSSINKYDYFQAVGAKAIIESESHISIDNQDKITDALDILNDYQNTRDRITEKSKSTWNGTRFHPETLEKYPEVKIDSLEINKFK